MYQWVVNLTFGVVEFSSFLNDTVWIFLWFFSLRRISISVYKVSDLVSVSSKLYSHTLISWACFLGIFKGVK